MIVRNGRRRDQGQALHSMTNQMRVQQSTEVALAEQKQADKRLQLQHTTQARSIKRIFIGWVSHAAR